MNILFYFRIGYNIQEEKRASEERKRIGRKSDVLRDRLPLLHATSSSGVVQQVQQEGVRLEVHLVSGLGHDGGDLLGGVQSSELNVSRVLGERCSDQLGRLRVSLRLDNCALFVLKSTVNDILGTFGILLGDLLVFNGSGVFLTEAVVGLFSYMYIYIYIFFFFYGVFVKKEANEKKRQWMITRSSAFKTVITYNIQSHHRPPPIER